MNLKKIFSALLALLLMLNVCGCVRDSGSAETLSQTDSTVPLTVTVTFPEGKTLVQIFQMLEENGVCSFDALMQAVQTADFSTYPLIAAVSGDKDRAFALEGYLFPDTYEFYTNDDPVSVIKKFLNNAETRIDDTLRKRAEERGITIDEAIIIASIVQREGSKSSEVKKIAGVIYNRLDDGMPLQMDTTIFYLRDFVKPYITGDKDRYDDRYDTYKCTALPKGPICCPGLETITAALYPTDVDYYYFCHDAAANYYYAETYKEHLKNVKTAGIS